MTLREGETGTLVAAPRPGRVARRVGTRNGTATPTVEDVAVALIDTYGDTELYNVRNPLWELLFIVCSTLTQESNYRSTYSSLRSAFPTLAVAVRRNRGRDPKRDRARWAVAQEGGRDRRNHRPNRSPSSAAPRWLRCEDGQTTSARGS